MIESDTLASPDLLGARFERELPVMGVRVRFRSNSERIDAVVERAFGHWRALPSALVGTGAPLEVTLIERASTPQPGSLRIRYGSGWLTASDGDSMLAACIDRGSALALVSEKLVADENRFRQEIVECATLVLVSQRDRTPMHASAVARNGVAVAFVGRSGGGKSTLTYACLRRGFDLLSEDVLHCSLRPGMRYWGNGGQVRLLPDAVRWFPELNTIEPRLLENGKTKLVVPVGRNALTAHSVHFCLLERGSGTDTKLERATPAELASAVGTKLEPGFELFPQVGALALEVPRHAVSRLVVGSDPLRAVEIVQTMVRT